jgi:hypothetical protein
MVPLTSSKATRSTGTCFFVADGASTFTNMGRMSPCSPLGILGDFDVIVSLTLSPALLMTYKREKKVQQKSQPLKI